MRLEPLQGKHQSSYIFSTQWIQVCFCFLFFYLIHVKLLQFLCNIPLLSLEGAVKGLQGLMVLN